MQHIADLIQLHPWLSGLLIAMPLFVLQGFFRFRATEARIPQETRVEFRLRRAARGMRLMGRANRILARVKAVRSGASSVPAPAMIRRLRLGGSDALEAASHFTAVLKALSSMKVSPHLLVRLDKLIPEATAAQEMCRREARSLSRHEQSLVSPRMQKVCPLLTEAGGLLDQVRVELSDWQATLTKAETEFSRTMDPTVFRSGGVFRNPFRPESSSEDVQTRNILDLRRSRDDYKRVARVTNTLQQLIADFAYREQVEPKGLATALGDILDEIDTCLAEADLPLPEPLASNETPATSSGSDGLLQRIYGLLVRAEVSSWAASG